MTSTTMTPEVLWAQRSSTSDPEKNYIFLTISAPDAPKIDVDMKTDSLTFTGHSTSKKTTYHVKLDFYGEIDVENSKTNHTSRDVEFHLRKKEMKEEYWPRLLKESKKVHFLKTDFDKWVDEDEQNAAPEDDAMGGGGMGGMEGMGGGMGGMGGMPGMGGGDGGFGGIDFSKLGGAGGMEGLQDMMGGMGGGAVGAGGEDMDDDEEMPGLEDEEPAEKSEVAAGKAAEESAPAAEAAPKAKIEEVS